MATCPIFSPHSLYTDRQAESVRHCVGFKSRITGREISCLKRLCKDRPTRRCNYEMYASLAMHSRVHQDFLRETGILGMCMGERKEELTNSRKLWWQTVHRCTCAGHLFLSLSFSLFSSIHPFYRDDIFASLLLLILFPILFFLCSSYCLYHCSRFTLIPRFSLISCFYSP